MDDQLIQELDLEPVVPIFINGKTQIAKHYNAHATIPVSSESLGLSLDYTVIVQLYVKCM